MCRGSHHFEISPREVSSCHREVSPATVVESLSKARALRTKPCQRAAEGPSSTAWTRPQILARGPKALNRLLLPAPATKQEPPTKGTAPELDTSGPFFISRTRQATGSCCEQAFSPEEMAVVRAMWLAQSGGVPPMNDR